MARGEAAAREEAMKEEELGLKAASTKEEGEGEEDEEGDSQRLVKRRRGAQ